MTIQEKATAYAEKAYYPTPEGGFYDSDHKEMEEVLADAYLAGATEALASQWVSVEERLPEDGEYVLIQQGKFTELSYFLNGDFVLELGGHIFMPTHWLPIPALPTKGGEE